MQCVSDLGKLKDRVVRRVRTLQQVVAPITLPLEIHDRRTLAYATIELDNLVIVALRQFTKSSLLGARTANGQRVVASVCPNNPEEAAAFVFSSLNPVGYQRMQSPASIPEKKEIISRDPKDTEKVFIDYATSNLSNLQLALSLNALAFSELRVCRHFFAHRMKSTADAVIVMANNTGLLSLEDAEHLLVTGRPTTGVRYLDGWLADVHNFFDFAA